MSVEKIEWRDPAEGGGFGDTTHLRALTFPAVRLPFASLALGRTAAGGPTQATTAIVRTRPTLLCHVTVNDRQLNAQ